MNQDLIFENLSREEKNWGSFCHLAAFAGFVFPPVGFIFGPLIVWLIKKNEMPFVDDQGKEALNFQLTMLIIFIISCFLVLIFIGFMLLIFWSVFQLVIVIVAAIKASDGVCYRYPMTIHFIS